MAPRGQFSMARDKLGTHVNLRFEDSGLICEFDGPTQKTSSLSQV